MVSKPWHQARAAVLKFSLPACQWSHCSKWQQSVVEVLMFVTQELGFVLEQRPGSLEGFLELSAGVVCSIGLHPGPVISAAHLPPFHCKIIYIH